MSATRILQAKNGQYEKAHWNGRNLSGIDPVCDRVLVLPDRHAEKVGNVMVPDSIVDQASMSGTTGILVAVGPAAFGFDSTGFNRWPGDAPKPGPGARICFQRFAGEEYRGEDGQMYRLMDFRSIGATMGMAEVEDAPAAITFGSEVTFSSAEAA